MTKIASFLTNYRKWLIGAIVLVMTHVCAYGLGGVHADIRHAEKAVVVAQQETSTAKQETVAVINHNNQAAAERVEVKVRDLARERALEADLADMRTERDALQRVLHETTDRDPDCRLGLGDVRMLNYAADPRSGPSLAGASDPAVLAAYQEQTPSTVSCRAFVSGEIDVRVQYNELARRHDELVDWIENEVIEPQTTVDSPAQ